MGETIQVAVAQAGGGGDLFSFLLMMAVVFGIFYVFAIRPQRKQQLEHQNYLAGLKKGDEVVLSSGLIGKIFAVEDKTAVVEIAQNTRVKVLKQAISGSAARALERGAQKPLPEKSDKSEKADESAAAAATDGEPKAEENGEDKSAKGSKKGGRKHPTA